MDQITFAEAIELFKLPRKLGLTAGGEEITTNVGRFGPYVKYGAKYVSLKTDDPYEITPERALEVIQEKEIADANRLIRDFPEAKIQVLNGRYGPYITDKERNAKIPKDKDPKSLTLEECQALLAAAPVRSFGKWGKKNARPAPTRGANGKSGSANGTGARAAPESAPGARLKLAARASKAAADKKAPLEAGARGGVKAAARRSPTPRSKSAGSKPAGVKTIKKSATRKKP